MAYEPRSVYEFGDEEEPRIMSEKAPQPTEVLIKRLRRVAKWHDEDARRLDRSDLKAQSAARANTCWQAAARLEELGRHGRNPENSPERYDVTPASAERTDDGSPP